MEGSTAAFHNPKINLAFDFEKAIYVWRAANTFVDLNRFRGKMMDHPMKSELGMASQATYQITVLGKLSNHWADWFNGAIIRREHSRAVNQQTILICQIEDQAELFGILNRLNGLNFPLLCVNLIPDEEV